MKVLNLFGVTVGAMLFAATPLSIHVSPTTLPSVSLDRADARIGRPLTPLSVAGVHRRAYRRGYYGAGAGWAPGLGVGLGVGALAAGAIAASPYYGYSGYGYPSYGYSGYGPYYGYGGPYGHYPVYRRGYRWRHW
jgi:hypothetical protein